jgi:hypothetical protein
VNLFFAFLAAAYVVAVFLLAGSSVASALSRFNPYSLLHVPLYGVMAVLVLFSLLPFRPESPRPGTGERFWIGKLPVTIPVSRFLTAGILCVAVGVADEFHQLNVPGRKGSVSDVFLDAVGTVVALVLCRAFLSWKKKGRIQNPIE